MRVLVVLNTEDVFIETLKFWADCVHRKCVCAEMNERRIIWEGKHSSSWIKSNIWIPTSKVWWRFFGKISMNCIIVKVPLISMIGFNHIIEEDVSPLRTDDSVPEFIGNNRIRPVDIEVVEKVETTCYLLEGLMIILVHWACVDAEVSCYTFIVIASCC